MKTGEEPSPDSPRGNPSAHRPMTDSAETTGSLPRSERTAAAPSEQPSSSLFPEMIMEAIVDSANMQRAWEQVRRNRGATSQQGKVCARLGRLQPAILEIHSLD